MSEPKKTTQAKTKSEELFEQYLDQSGLQQWEYEPTIEGKIKKPDYQVTVQAEPIFFEVKEFEIRTPADSAGGAYDPYPGIRKKIEQLRQKFGEYKMYPCCGVLFSECHPEIDIESPEIVMGAMLGDLTIRIPIDRNTGFQTGQIKTIFGKRGKMINYKKMAPQNTTISALIALDLVRPGQTKFEIATAKQEQKIGKGIAEENFFDWVEEYKNQGNDLGEKVLRTVVFENPYASHPLRRDIFTGPFDERYGPNEGYIKRVFVGDGLAEIQSEEEKYGLDLGPLAKTLNKEW